MLFSILNLLKESITKKLVQVPSGGPIGWASSQNVPQYGILPARKAGETCDFTQS